MAKNYMLTTLDNPYNPFENFKEWYLWDVEMGYNTCSKIAHIAETTESMSEDYYYERVNEAIDELIALDIMGMYKRVTEEDYDGNTLLIRNDGTIDF